MVRVNRTKRDQQEIAIQKDIWFCLRNKVFLSTFPFNDFPHPDCNFPQQYCNMCKASLPDGAAGAHVIDSSTATTAAEDIIHFNQWEVKINAIPSPNEIHFLKAVSYTHLTLPTKRIV